MEDDFLGELAQLVNHDSLTNPSKCSSQKNFLSLPLPIHLVRGHQCLPSRTHLRLARQQPPHSISWLKPTSLPCNHVSLWVSLEFNVCLMPLFYFQQPSPVHIGVCTTCDVHAYYCCSENYSLSSKSIRM